MKKMLIILACLFGALAVGGVVFMSFFMFGSGSSRTVSMMAELAQTHNYAAKEVVSVEIDLSYESIHFYTSDTETIKIEDYRTPWSKDKMATVSLDNGHLKVTGKKYFSFIGFQYGYINVYLPSAWGQEMNAKTVSGKITGGEETFAFSNLQLKSSSGSVTFNTLTCSKNATLQSTSGGVKTGDITAGGAVTLKSSSGAVLSGKVSGTSLHASSTSGSVTVDKAQTTKFDISSVSGAVRIWGGTGFGVASSSSGSVTIELQELTGNITAKSTSGTVRLSLPRESSFAFQASTTSGSIRTPIDDMLSFDKRGKNATGSYGEKPEYTVTTSSSAGSIHLAWV